MDTDIENQHLSSGEQGLYNNAIRTYSWHNINVGVSARGSGRGKNQDGTDNSHKLLLSNISGQATAGSLVALMGPSGSGKTTLLNVLARRPMPGLRTQGQLLIDGQPCPSLSDFNALSSFVEQEDKLIGSLTARETVDFAARMASTHISSPAVRKRLVDNLMQAFGLQDQANVMIGTALRKGVSGGQKRRISVASQLVTGPKLLFLDEPVSGLDSTASREVISFIRDFARKFQIIVICSIHQPSTVTFNMFDQLVLLARGNLCYAGPVEQALGYFESIGYPAPPQINPAEYLLDLVNADFSASDGHESKSDTVTAIHAAWRSRHEQYMPTRPAVDLQDETSSPLHPSKQSFLLPVLLHRAWIKSYRDLVAYGVRIAMYLGLAIMMGTVWVRLPARQESIQPFINALFFGGAFTSFMAVSYVPAYLEDFHVFQKDRANGLYGPAQFMAANFIIGVPFLFLITILFSVVSYWLIGFQPTGKAFFTFIMWLFLDLLAAESLVVLLSSLIPVFVVALALVAFANGLWMAVGGFLVPLPQLNVFYKYVFHYIDYQAYVFQGMMVNEFEARTYDCGGSPCSYPSQGLQGSLPGTSVLQRYGYATGKQGQWVGIMISIIVVYRLLGLAVMRFKR